MWFKGIIMQIYSDYSVVMTDDSSILKVKNKENMQIGDMIIFLEEDIYIQKKQFSKSNIIKPILSFVAIITLIFIPFIKSNMNYSYALLSLDINPSIEFELDKNKKIKIVNGLNKDAKKLELISLKGLSIDEGIKKLKLILDDNKYNLKKENIIVGFTFLRKDKSVKYEDYIRNLVSDEFKKSNIIYLKGNKKDFEKSSKKGISLGRYETKINSDEDILEEELEKMSVDELVNLLNKESRTYLNEEYQKDIEDEIEDKLDKHNDNEKLDDDSIENDENDENDDSIKNDGNKKDDNKKLDNDENDSIDNNNENELDDNDDIENDSNDDIENESSNQKQKIKLNNNKVENEKSDDINEQNDSEDEDDNSDSDE